MIPESSLQRFTQAHQLSYATALQEIRSGKKHSHWMWYIFPQLRGLGQSDLSHYYGICDLDEAAAFLKDPYLGKNLIEISEALLQLETSSATEVFGKTDNRKLRSSMTLFSCVSGAPSVFHQVLDKYFDGRADMRTKRMLNL